MRVDVENPSQDYSEIYDEIIIDGEAMKRFLEKSDDIEKIKFYKYVLRRATNLSKRVDKDSKMIQCCWLASVELSETDAIKKYLNKEITEKDIQAWDEEQERLIQNTLEAHARKQYEKRNKHNPFVQVPRAISNATNRLKVVLMEKKSERIKKK